MIIPRSWFNALSTLKISCVTKDKMRMMQSPSIKINKFDARDNLAKSGRITQPNYVDHIRVIGVLIQGYIPAKLQFSIAS